ncbi:MAG: hypothetical protein J6X22_04215 [Muribaculaceae bacterium]|nr:hypothetical protein [Muribaculaceae bacterium]
MTNKEPKHTPTIVIKYIDVNLKDDINDMEFAEYPAVGVVIYNGGENACVICEGMAALVQSMAKFFIRFKELEDFRFIQATHINGYYGAENLKVITGVIGSALNEFHDGGNRHELSYEWEDSFADRIMFIVDDTAFFAYKEGGIQMIT